MLGFPETLQQHSPRILAAVPVSRPHDPEAKGVRGRRLDSLGSTGETEASTDFYKVWTLSSLSHSKEASAENNSGSSVSVNVCVHEYGVMWT